MPHDLPEIRLSTRIGARPVKLVTRGIETKWNRSPLIGWGRNNRRTTTGGMNVGLDLKR